MSEFVKKQNKDFVPPPAKNVVAASGEASAQALLSTLNRYLEEANGRVHKKVSGFHPSYNNQCPRYWFMLFEGADAEFKVDGRGYRIFHNGSLIHEKWQAYFKQMGILIGKEIPVSTDDPIPIRGHADAIIEWGGEKLIELKSIGPDGFQFRKLYNKPKDEHYRQSQFYLHGLKLKKGFIIYENKGNSEVLIFPIEYDKPFLDKEFKKRIKIYNLIKEDKLPERPYKRESKQCTSCELEKWCWENMKD